MSPAHRAFALALLALLPALAGCTFPRFGPPPPPPPEVKPSVVQAAFVVPDVNLSLENAWGHVVVQGKALAVGYQQNGTEVGAVYFGANTTWRVDARFQARGQQGLQGPVFVQAPLGTWPAMKAKQAWTPATEADWQAQGFATPNALFHAASEALPAKDNAPLPQTWTLNGTLAVRFDPGNATIATVTPPFVFQRNFTDMIVVETSTVLRWSETNHSLDGSNDALLHIALLDERLAGLELDWGPSKIDARITTPSFRAGDLKVDNDKVTKIASATLPGVAELAVVKYATFSVEDNRVDTTSQNITVRFGP